jgi:hypothetical protein
MALQCAGLNMLPDPDRILRTPPAATGGRLDSWKEIADYLRRGLTTAQRWEREEGLPIRRHVHGTGGSVFAYVGELDRWLLGREPAAIAEPVNGSIPSTVDARGEVPGGAMPLASSFYIARDADGECRQAIAQGAAIVLIKGARQVGKSSLLARALADARQERSIVAFTDIQALGADDLISLKALYQALGRSLAAQIKGSSSIVNAWNDHDSPNTNLSRCVIRLVSSVRSQVVWGIDELDRLVGRDYAADIFGLFQSWHNLRALDPAAPWSRLTLAIACATECHLLIADAHESPFDVGVRMTLDDFDPADVARLNDRHGSPVDSPTGVNRLMDLVGGHPYLLQCSFDALRRGASLGTIEREARGELGPFGDHLRRIRLLLQREPALRIAMNPVLKGGACEQRDSFRRLRDAGILHGASPAEARPRCGLYRQLLSEAS